MSLSVMNVTETYIEEMILLTSRLTDLSIEIELLVLQILWLVK